MHDKFCINNYELKWSDESILKKDISKTQNTTEFGGLANNVDFKQSIRQLAKSFRSDLSSKIKDEKVSVISYRSFSNDEGYNFNNDKQCFPELSHI